jgi:hypothetical protein
MSRTTDDNLGRRRYLLHRDKAVEHALERIRHAPHAGWETLTPQEHAGLKAALTEIWESCGRERWQQYCFSTLSKDDLLRLIGIVAQAKGRFHHACEDRDAIEKILLTCSIGDPTSQHHPK